MNNNINYYNSHCADYISSSSKLNMDAMIDRFALYGGLKKGAMVLDAGCGSGRDSLYMSKNKGFSVSAFDASIEMVKSLEKQEGIEVKQLKFSEFDQKDMYDGIWACASLLHVHFNEFEDALTRLILGLKKGGILYFSIKKAEDGVKEWHIGDRTFYHPGNEKINEIAKNFDLSLVDFFCTGKIDDISQTFENYFFIKH